MTRMLCSIIAIFLCCSLVGGCSLFRSDEETRKVEEIDSSSVAGTDELGDDVLDASDEMAAETDDLLENSDSFP